MRKVMLVAGIIALVMTLGLGFGYAQTATKGTAQGGWYCPWQSTVAGTGYSRPAGGNWNCPRVGYWQGQSRGKAYGKGRHGGCMGYGRGYRNWGASAPRGLNDNNSAAQNQAR